MKKIFYRHSFPAVLFLLVFFAFGASQTNAATVYGVTSNNQLVKFGATSPGTVTTVGAITGLQSGETVLGIDFRPATGQLFALGSNSRLYTINKMTAAATFVGTLSTPLSGTTFGFDFNPTVDRIRIVSDTDQNLRVNPNNASAIVDGTLAFSAGDPNAGQNPNVAGAAYTGSFTGTTSTALYDIDSNLDILVTQNPANSGMLQTVGSLGVNTTNVVGFDHTAASNIAYAALTVVAVPNFYTVNLTTGAATLIGAIGNLTVTDIAVEIGASPALTAYGLTADKRIVTFNTKNPNAPTSTVTVTGLQGGESLRGIDFRPATGQLFGISDMNRLFIVNRNTGAATLVGTLNNGATFPDVGFDFNPTVDRIRLVTEADENRRINPTDATAIVDGTLMYMAGDPNAGANPNIVAAGYTNSFGGATSTALYDIDSNLDILAQQNPANAGTLQTIGGLTWNTSDNAGLDIFGGNNTALATLELIIGGNPAGNSGLYQIDLATGTAAFIAPVGINSPIISLAVSNASAATRTVDFDGDGRTDYAVFRPENNTWYFRRSSDGSNAAVQFGQVSTDYLTPGDYDGDGKTDIAVWRETNGVFYYIQSSDGAIKTFPFGSNGDEPVARDYDGDGKTDFAVVRRSGGLMTWYIRNSANGSIRIEQFGLSSDFVAPGDYDGDGKFDLSVYRGSPAGQAVFYVQGSLSGFMTRQWGLGGDLVVPGDYDGDGLTCFSVLRAGIPYTWYILSSATGGFSAPQWGTKPHYSAQGDYDGDGKTDVAVWDPITAQFYVLKSTGGTSQVQYGENGDYPVANFDTH